MSVKQRETDLAAHVKRLANYSAGAKKGHRVRQRMRVARGDVGPVELREAAERRAMVVACILEGIGVERRQRKRPARPNAVRELAQCL